MANIGRAVVVGAKHIGRRPNIGALAPGTAPVVTADLLLMETGTDKLLLENGTDRFLLE